MCGRLACGLEPKEICISCIYQQTGRSEYTTPQWKNCYNSGKTFKSSNNIRPNEIVPVLLSGNHFKINSRLITPMIFGLMPQWTKGNDSRYSTINCRIETAMTSKLYGPLLKKGQRCAVICNGFYEWYNHKHSGNKNAYFVHGVQPDRVQENDPKPWNVQLMSKKHFSGFRPLKLAALFEINSCKNLDEATLSFTIITKEADSKTSWLHKRIPAVLETDMQLEAWLNYKEVDADCALKCISHSSNLICVPVSNLVNIVTNKDIFSGKQEKKCKKEKSSFLQKWLNKKKRKIDEIMENGCEKIRKSNY